MSENIELLKKLGFEGAETGKPWHSLILQGAISIQAGTVSGMPSEEFRSHVLGKFEQLRTMLCESINEAIARIGGQQ